MTEKANIYPVRAKLVGDSEIQIDILQISSSGILVDSLNTPLAVGQTFQLHLEFPLIDAVGEVSVVILRTYAELNPAGLPRKTRHMNELFFKKPPRAFNELLIKFLAQASLRQKT